MSSERDGGPAFPRTDFGKEPQNGMTLWDYYAGQALIMLSGGTSMERAIEAGNQADAMMIERAKRSETA